MQREHPAVIKCRLTQRLRTTGMECMMDVSLMAQVVKEAGLK